MPIQALFYDPTDLDQSSDVIQGLGTHRTPDVAPGVTVHRRGPPRGTPPSPGSTPPPPPPAPPPRPPPPPPPRPPPPAGPGAGAAPARAGGGGGGGGERVGGDH